MTLCDGRAEMCVNDLGEPLRRGAAGIDGGWDVGRRGLKVQNFGALFRIPSEPLGSPSDLLH